MKNKLLILLSLCMLLFGCTNSNDEKYVYKLDDNIEYIFYYKDDTVTDFEIYVNFTDSEIANNSLYNYKKMYENDSNVESISVKDKYIVINYIDEYVYKNFGTDSIELIKMMKVTEK